MFLFQGFFSPLSKENDGNERGKGYIQISDIHSRNDKCFATDRNRHTYIVSPECLKTFLDSEYMTGGSFTESPASVLDAPRSLENGDQNTSIQRYHSLR